MAEFVSSVDKHILLGDQHYHRHRRYWEHQLRDCHYHLPLVMRDPQQDAVTVSTVRTQVPAGVAAGILQVCSRNEMLVYVYLLAVVKCVAHRYFAHDDITVISPINTELENEYTLNEHIPIRCQIGSDDSFRQALVKVKAAVIAAHEHQDFPMTELEVAAKNAGSLFSNVFARMDGLHHAGVPGQRNLLGFTFTIDGDSLFITLSFDEGVYEKEGAENLLAHFVNFLGGIVGDVNVKIGAVDYLSAPERERLLDYSRADHNPSPDHTLISLWELQCRTTPDHVAVVLNERSVTYRELDARANAVAAALVARGVKTDTVAAICLSRSIEMIAAVLGVMKAGAAYLPLDADLPADRCHYMLSSAGAELLITHSSLALSFEPPSTVIHIDTLKPSGAVAESRCRPDGLAYVIFTSGTTGKPKGVLVDQRCIANAIAWRKNAYGLGSHDRVLQLFNFSFDGFLTSLFTPLVSGAAVVLTTDAGSRDPEIIASLLQREHITHFICVPSLFRQLLDNMTTGCDTLRSVTLAGENTSEALIDAVHARLPGVKLFNEYGPTENAVVSSCHLIRNARDGGMIGRPIDGTAIYVLDPEGRLLPAGVPGELYLGGNNLSRGYLNDPALTSEAFRVMFIENKAHRVYRTGDLGMWDFNGCLHFLGRKDSQVKINGFRIELAEIENLLLKYPGVKNAAVVVREAGRQKTLIAFIESASAGVVVGLRDFLAAHVPYYMMPAEICHLEQLPMSLNGKVDRKELSRMVAERPVRVTADREELPEGEREKALAAIWKQALKIETLGRNDNFFLLGGDSIKAVQILSKARDKGFRIGVREIFTYPTVALLASYLEGRTEHDRAASAAEKLSYTDEAEAEAVRKIFGDNAQDVYPLSPLQEGILFQSLSAENGAYFVQSSFEIKGSLDTEMVQRALDFLVERHDALRTSYLYESVRRPLQVVLKKRNISVVVQDISVAEKPQLELDNYRLADRNKAFDLIQDPLLRLAVFRLGEDRYQLVWSFHHIALDGWCFNILSAEFFAAYASLMRGETPVSEQITPYREYIDWIERQDKRDGAAYWQKYLEAYDELSSVPRASGTSTPDSAFSTFEFAMTREVSDGVRKLAGEYRVTLNSLVQAAWGVLLARYNSRKDVVFGSVNMGRPQDIQGVERMIGLFINTLPLRVKFTRETSFASLAREVQGDIVTHETQSHISLAEVQRNHHLRNALFDHILIFNYQGAGEDPTGIVNELGFSFSNLSSREQTNYALNVTVSALADIRFRFSYNASMYNDDFIRNIGHHLSTMICQLMQEPSLPVHALRMMPADERARVIDHMRGIADRDKITGIFLSRIEDHADRFPNRPAVAHGNNVITYGELNGKANALARQIIAAGVKPNSLVTVVVNRSLELPLCLLAVLKAGAAFIPVDAYWPVNRIREVLSNVRESLVLSNNPELSLNLGHDRILNVDFSTLARDAQNPGIQVSLEDPIYCIFTSGSTGKPKGVINKHLGIVNRFLYMDKRYKPVENDVVMLTSNHTFDSAVWQLLWPLTNGIRTVIPDDNQLLDLDHLIRLIDRHKVTITDFVPSVFNLLVQWLEEKPEYRNRLSTLRQLLIGGEAMSSRHIYQFRSYLENVSITNTYGPTETSIGTIFHEVRPEYQEPIPIGKPIDNVNVLLLDDDGLPVPTGVPGEICLGGICTGLGYLNAPEKTSEVFIPSPVSEYAGEIFYRTGDKAKLLPDGTIEFIGRIDNQLKIRGVRVELGEIETRILLNDRIREATVLHDTASGKARLIAFVVAHDDLDVRTLREFLLLHLPDAMIPSRFISVEKIPLLASGKTDKHALREILKNDEAQQRPEASANGTDFENTVAAVWREVLKVDRLGLDDHFFELGGNSLDILRLHGKLKTAIDFKEPLVRLIQYPTVRSLVRFLQHGGGAATDEHAARRSQRKENQRGKRKKMHQLQREQYELHGASYTSRINNRRKYQALDVEDKIIISMLEKLVLHQSSVLIDAGCGTGDRLKLLLEKRGGGASIFTTRYGIDFSAAMIGRAATQQLAESKLYDALYQEDLTAAAPDVRGDLVLCLWCVVNESLEQYPQTLRNLSAMVKPGGYLIFDITTDYASPVYAEFDSLARGLNPEYDLESPDQTYLIQREDATVAYLKLFSREEVENFSGLLGMKLCYASGYNHHDKDDGGAATGALADMVRDCSGLILCFQKPSVV